MAPNDLPTRSNTEPVRWYMLERYAKFESKILIDTIHGETIIKSRAKNSRQQRDILVIEKRCCEKSHSVINSDLLKSIQEIFSITPEDLLQYYQSPH